MTGLLTVTNVSRGRPLAGRVRLADRWWSRLRGLLGRGPLGEEEGLLLVPCRAVHMVGMRYAIDVAFVDRAGAVVAAYHGLKPGRRSGWHPRARMALELPAGRLQRTGTREGDTLAWHPATETVR